jgi:4-hydroxy 2-oxovalerate aldolase
MKNEIKLRYKKLLDFCIIVQLDKFDFKDSYFTALSTLFLAYILGIAGSGKASRIFLTGFDSYNANDPRTIEAVKLFNIFQKTIGVPNLISITNTSIKLSQFQFIQCYKYF